MKTHYTAFEAANMIFLKATKKTAPRYIHQLYLQGELTTSTKISQYWCITHEDVVRIKERIWSGALKVVLPRYEKPIKENGKSN